MSTDESFEQIRNRKIECYGCRKEFKYEELFNYFGKLICSKKCIPACKKRVSDEVEYGMKRKTGKRRTRPASAKITR